MGQVDFGSGCGFRARRGSAGLTPLQVGTHTFCLIVLQRTGVRLLLRNSNGFENIKNGPALDFQFTC